MNYKENNFEKVYKDLTDQYSEKLNNLQEEVINEKKDTRKAILRMALIIIPIVILVVYITIITKNIKMIEFTALFIPAAIIIIITRGNYDKEAEYHRTFKQDIINSLIQSFSNELRYEPEGKILEKTYREANFGEKFNSFSSYDLIKGNIYKNLKLEMAEVDTEYIYDKNHAEKCFNGLFSRVDMPKTFESELYIRKKLFIFNNNCPRIEMDSSEFEKIFNIYSSNKILAMQLLTSDVMEMILEYNNEINRTFDITIKGNYIYIRVKENKMFEIIDKNKSLLDKENIYRNYVILKFIINLSIRLTELISETPT